MKLCEARLDVSKNFSILHLKSTPMKTLKLALILCLGISLSACDKEGMCNEGENEKEIKVSELPLVVRNSINEQYPGAELKEADEITQSDGSITYDVEIRHNNSDMEVMYDSNGQFLGTESDDDDKD